MSSKHNQTFASIFGMYNTKKGDVGIEIELEGAFLPAAIGGHWTGHVDNSLRNYTDPEGLVHAPREYVINGVINHEEVPKALKQFSDALVKAKAKPVLSNRCSVHVHVNASQLTVKQVYTWLACYYILEEPLIKFCGPDREGNLFCLGGCDSQYAIDALAAAADGQRNFAELNDQNLKYTACNVWALYNYGSLEFRAHGGTTDTSRIQQWIDILMQIREASLAFDGPQAVVQEFSNLGAIEFARKLLGETHFYSFRYMADFEKSLYEGMRLSQDIAWATTWAPTQAIEVKKPKKDEGADDDEEPIHIWDQREEIEIGMRHPTDPTVIWGYNEWGEFEWIRQRRPVVAPPAPRPRRAAPVQPAPAYYWGRLVR